MISRLLAQKVCPVFSPRAESYRGQSWMWLQFRQESFIHSYLLQVFRYNFNVISAEELEGCQLSLLPSLSNPSYRVSYGTQSQPRYLRYVKGGLSPKEWPRSLLKLHTSHKWKWPKIFEKPSKTTEWEPAAAEKRMSREEQASRRSPNSNTARRKIS